MLIAKEYFSHPRAHGYIYPSVAHKLSYNMAIESEVASELLEFVNLRIMTYVKDNDDGFQIRIDPRWSNSIVDGKIQYVTALTSPANEELY